MHSGKQEGWCTVWCCSISREDRAQGPTHRPTTVERTMADQCATLRDPSDKVSLGNDGTCVWSSASKPRRSMERVGLGLQMPQYYQNEQ